MIPERDDFWLSPPAPIKHHHHHQPAPASSPSPPPAAAASGTNQLLQWNNVHLRDNDFSVNAARIEKQTAWMKYHYFVKTMQTRGQEFDKTSMLEAMFRGGNLVYSPNVECS